ncbi:MAG: hypothetical protein J1E57_02895 [Prevotella sp.]|nr:hypothetical protein [Prevotella sp.]
MNTRNLIKNSSKYLKKIKTNIIGFDYLLYDGLDLTNDHTVIVIQGDKTTERTLFGLQLLYGIGQSLPGTHLHYFSNYQSEDVINDLLLDSIISSCIRRMTEMYVSNSNWAQLSNGVSSVFFDKSEILCQQTSHEFYEKLPVSDILHKTDELICEEAIYYSNRTNSLHFRSYLSSTNSDIRNPLEGYVKTEKDNILFARKYDHISEYFANKDEDKEKIHQLGEFLSYKFVNVGIQHLDCLPWKNDESYIKENNTCVTAIDMAPFKRCCDVNSICHENKQLLSNIEEFRKHKNHHEVLILIVPETMDIPEHLVDIYIKMESRLIFNYQVNFLSIRKSRTQTCAIGWHQYKRRDHGIEVYPSIHNYFSQRRYLQRAMVYTHSDVITDTYQQYLDRNRYYDKKDISFKDFEKDREQMKDDYFKALYPKYDISLDCIDILGRIFLSDKRCDKEQSSPDSNPNDVNNLIYGYRGGVTAIIGESNTYKRFVTFGSAFSSSVNQEHTLFLLLNKEDNMIRRRLACPARVKKNKACEECKKCYSYMHFMNISMGNITPDELIFFLQSQLEVCFRDGKKIKRVIMDDLEIIDFCFPFLKKSQLFLSALAAVCREKNISLYILCDKESLLVRELRAVADNIICMGRDGKGKLLMYIEKFAGYNNTPSKIYCGKVSSVKDLFLCYDMMDSQEHTYSYYSFSSKEIDDYMVNTMEDFWHKNLNNK